MATFAGFFLVESILPAIATADFIFLAFPAAAAFKPVAVLLVVVPPFAAAGVVFFAFAFSAAAVFKAVVVVLVLVPPFPDDGFFFASATSPYSTFALVTLQVNSKNKNIILLLDESE